MDRLQEESVHVLVAMEVIEHLSDYRNFFRNAWRLCKPGGRLYLTTPNRLSVDLLPNKVLRYLASPKILHGVPLVKKLFGPYFSGLLAEEISELASMLPPWFSEHTHEFAPEELKKLLLECGFRIAHRWATPPQVLFHEIRFAAFQLIPLWYRFNEITFHLGGQLHLIAVKDPANS